uniref:Paraneoplastic antigen Ma-like C-terminal domain-containing protein n=1 Tax=Acanthochromis polyacanthus TaxID=80966 RepID=A0A3Q1ETV5_9TELE
MMDVKTMAKLSGKEYGEILQEMMSQINKSIVELNRPAADVNAEEEQLTPPVSVKQSDSPVTNFPSASRSSFVPPDDSNQRGERRSTLNMAASDLTPPEVQRYVVEHVVRSGDGAHSSHRFRTFSGKVPRPAHETDYDTWRSGVELVLRDPAISDLQRTRLIRDSLLPPAADIVKHLSPDTLPGVYLQQLESAYGTVQDGDELYAKFLDTYQDVGEKPSTYLQRLQVALQHAVRRGGVPARDVDKRLLTQFCRGCWDNNLIVELQLKQRKNDPPPFAELLLLLRTEEDQDATKTMRMKQHLGVTKHKISNQAQLVRA